jgi:hypothetical protein
MRLIQLLLVGITLCVGVGSGRAQQAPAEASEPVEFGGTFSELSAEQQQLIDDWVARFRELSGQDVDAEPFYDNYLRLSTRTTFQAVTHALETTALTDESGASLGSALSIVERVDSVHGKIKGRRGDEQFRMYVVLKDGALDTLDRSREFSRGAPNTVYHKGYPINYRQAGGVPSIQVSIARDEKHADIDVDYRSSSFPVALFNGHLSSSNSDVRAGNNDERHNSRWSGFQNWWRGFFGIRAGQDDVDAEAETGTTKIQLTGEPRAGAKDVDEMMYDFLSAWLVEGDIAAAMRYVSPQAYPCVAIGAGEDPSEYDRGMAPFRIMMGMRNVKERVGNRASLEGLTVGVRVYRPGVKVVQQPHHAQFVLYALPDRMARDISCTDPSSLALKPVKAPSGEFGNYYAGAFYIAADGTDGPKGATVALLWAKEDGFWKVIAYEVEPEGEPEVAAPAVAAEEITRVPADETLARRAEQLLTAWLVDRDYDKAFSYLSPRCYACYNLFRAADRPEAKSTEEAGQRLREGMERVGETLGRHESLANVLEPVEPVNAAVRVLTHPNDDVYTLVSFPDAVIEFADCANRSSGVVIPRELPRVYGKAFGTYFRLRLAGGEAPVLRFLWTREGGDWMVTAYDIELP